MRQLDKHGCAKHMYICAGEDHGYTVRDFARGGRRMVVLMAQYLHYDY